MAPTVYRVKLRWDGFVGAPGYSIFHFRDLSESGGTLEGAQAATDKVDAFAEAIKGFIPYNSRLTVQSDVEVYESTNGELQTIIGVAADPAHVSLATIGMNYSSAAGVCITWRSPQVRNSRRIRGRTFLVPLVAAVWGGDGIVAAGNMATLNAAASALRNDTGAPDLIVWARPTSPGATDGELAAINSHNIGAAGAILRSRRD
jgi:hypothetical protein